MARVPDFHSCNAGVVFVLAIDNQFALGAVNLRGAASTPLESLGVAGTLKACARAFHTLATSQSVAMEKFAMTPHFRHPMCRVQRPERGVT